MYGMMYFCMVLNFYLSVAFWFNLAYLNVWSLNCLTPTYERNLVQTRGATFSVSTFFHPKNLVISKKKSSLYTCFRPKVKVLTGGHRHGAIMKK